MQTTPPVQGASIINHQNPENSSWDHGWFRRQLKNFVSGIYQGCEQTEIYCPEHIFFTRGGDVIETDVQAKLVRFKPHSY